MTMIRKLIAAEINALGDDEVEVIMSTAALARDGHVLVPQGGRLDNYRANPIVLWSHNTDKPVGNSEDLTVDADKIRARVRFAPIGVSAQADETRGLVKAGVVRAVSVGFDPIEGEPLNANKPRGGQRFTDWELLELSFVSVPSDTGAVVTARSHGDNDMADEEGAASRQAKTHTRATAARTGTIGFKRGLYDVASLIYTFQSLGYQVDNAKFEAAIEGDGSGVPAMLIGVLQDFGEAIIAMTEEEIAEALACHATEADDDPDDDLIVLEERTHIREAKTPMLRALRRGMAHAKIRAGKTLSTETVRCLREAADLHSEAIDLHRSAIRKSKEGVAGIHSMIERAGSSEPYDKTGEEGGTSSGETPDDGTSDAGDRAASPDYTRRQAELQALAAA